eukprot:COSAG01_NODE_27110_length_694_cov_0.673950_3_plen_20_part_01
MHPCKASTPEGTYNWIAISV